MAAALTIRPMTRPELDTLVDWAADEGWNPGLNDADIFWDTDPDGFIAAERGGTLIGGGELVICEVCCALATPAEASMSSAVENVLTLRISVSLQLA